jgi:hypothetical protein
MKTPLLYNETPLFVLPSLAVDIGLNEAILLQSIHDGLLACQELEIAKIDGHYWVTFSIAKWKEKFSFWSEKTISRTLNNLKKQNFIIARNLIPSSKNRTLSYTINYQYLAMYYVPNNPHRA